ncbi:MAG TPA: hypothetical protein VKR58_06040 [Aquella sp.]|nr:hypothetical protein [Aquella sp.]
MNEQILEATVVGVQFCKNRGTALLETYLADKKNADLSLQEKPDNEYNPRAVAVNINGYDGEVFQLGWIPDDDLDEYYDWKEKCINECIEEDLDPNDLDFYISSNLYDEDGEPFCVNYIRSNLLRYFAVDFIFRIK